MRICCTNCTNRLFYGCLNFFTGREQLCRRERLCSCRGGREGGGKEREQQGRSAWTQESERLSRLFSLCFSSHSVWCDSKCACYQLRRKRKRSGDSDDEASASESDSDSDSDSNSNCSDKPKKKEEAEDKDDEEEEGEGGELRQCCPLLFRCPFQAVLVHSSVFFSLLIKKRRSQRRAPRRRRRKRRRPKMTLPGRGPSTGPALCSWGASPPPFQKLRSLLWVCTEDTIRVTEKRQTHLNPHRQHSRPGFSLSSAGGTLASCVSACPTLILSAGWCESRKQYTNLDLILEAWSYQFESCSLTGSSDAVG